MLNQIRKLRLKINCTLIFYCFSLSFALANEIDFTAVKEHQKLCQDSGADSCLIYWKGQIIAQWYGAQYKSPTTMMSSTKSVTALLVGMLIDEGKITSLDDPVGKYISEWRTGIRAKVTLRHLLTHTSGLPEFPEGGVGFEADKNTFVINLSPTKDPGTVFSYSNEAVQLLSPILDKAAGEPIQVYAKRKLFDPLGMKESSLRLDAKGHAWTYADMNSTPQDFLQIGRLMIQKGLFQGKRIVSREWIDLMTTASQKFQPICGLLWWLFPVESDLPGLALLHGKGYATLGYLNTNMYVFPTQELIVVRTQQTPKPHSIPYEKAAYPLFVRLFNL